MKKILFAFFVMFLSFKVYAIESIKVNEENIIPSYDKNIKKYNYFTDNNEIIIKVKNENDEIITGDGLFFVEDGINKYIVNSNIYGDYEINVYKNYKEDKETLGVLNNLTIKNYDINFSKDVFEYEIVINNEDNLEIDYELLNDSSYVDIVGNGNFNKDKNVIEINVDNINTYKINVLKTSSVFKRMENINKVNDEMSPIKKEIVKLLIITISCVVVFFAYYLLFIKKLF